MENEVGDPTVDLEEQAREFVQSLVSVLGEQRQFVSNSPSSTAVTPETMESQQRTLSEPSSSSSDSNSTNGISQEVQGYVIRFSDDKVIPENGQKPHDRQSQNMGSAIDYLVEEYDLIDVIDVPHFPPKARKNCSINTEPTHPNGEEMRLPYELSNGYYLHAHLGRQAKMSRIRNLAEQVGLSVSFLDEW